MKGRRVPIEDALRFHGRFSSAVVLFIVHGPRAARLPRI